MTDTDTRRRSRQPEGECSAISERLVERLREMALFDGVGPSPLCSGAADRIEALEAERSAWLTTMAAREADDEAEAAVLREMGDGLDRFDAAAEKWLALGGVDRMVQAITSVFAKWSSDDLMARFREKVKALMHQAFVEGAVAYAAGIKVANSNKPSVADGALERHATDEAKPNGLPSPEAGVFREEG